MSSGSIGWGRRDKRLGEEQITREPPRAWSTKRWWTVASIAVVLLALYAAALTWTSQRLEADIQKSMHVLSGPIPDHP